MMIIFSKNDNNPYKKIFTETNWSIYWKLSKKVGEKLQFLKFYRKFVDILYLFRVKYVVYHCSFIFRFTHVNKHAIFDETISLQKYLVILQNYNWFFCGTLTIS